MLKCTRINYNWRQIGESDSYSFESYIVGKDGVVEISNTEERPEMYDVIYSDGRVTTVHNVNQAFYVDEEKNVKPPLGLMPEKLHNEKRLIAILSSVDRYAENGKEIPIEWIKELASLIRLDKPECIEDYLMD